MRSIHDSLTITKNNESFCTLLLSRQFISFSRALHMYYIIMCVRCTIVTYWGLHHSQNNYDWIISAVTMAVFFTSSTIVNKHTNINNTDIVITSAGVGLQV